MNHFSKDKYSTYWENSDAAVWAKSAAASVVRKGPSKRRAVSIRGTRLDSYTELSYDSGFPTNLVGFKLPTRLTPFYLIAIFVGRHGIIQIIQIFCLNFK